MSDEIIESLLKLGEDHPANLDSARVMDEGGAKADASKPNSASTTAPDATKPNPESTGDQQQLSKLLTDPWAAEYASQAIAGQVAAPYIASFAKGAVHEATEHPLKALGTVAAGIGAGLTLPELVAGAGVAGVATAATVAVGGIAYEGYQGVKQITRIVTARTDAESQKDTEGLGGEFTDLVLGTIGGTSGVRLATGVAAAAKDIAPIIATKIGNALGAGETQVAVQMAGNTAGKEVLPTTSIISNPLPEATNSQGTAMLTQAGDDTAGGGGASTPEGIAVSNAIKQGQSFKGVGLSSKDLSDADLALGDFESANLSFTDLHGANMLGANLVKTTVEGADLSGAILDKAYVQQVDFVNVNLQGTSFREADITGAGFMLTDLQGADLRGANIEASDFSGANLRNSDFRGANIDIASTHFELADLSGAKADPAMLHTLITRGAYSDLSLSDFLPHDLATEMGNLPGKPRVAAILSWQDTIANHPSWQEEYATDGQFRQELHNDFQRRFSELNSNDQALSGRTDNMLMVTAARENSLGASPYGKALYEKLVLSLTHDSEGNLVSDREERAMLETLNQRGTPIVQQLNPGVFKTIVDRLDPTFKEKPDSREASVASDNALQLALTFGREWKSYLKLKGVDIDEPGPLSAQSQQKIHDASYWLPVAPPQELQGLSTFLRQNVNADTSDLGIIARSWPTLSENEKKLPVETLVERLLEDTLKSYKVVKSQEFAAESARWNIPEGEYRSNEHRFLASLDTPSPFPLDKTWTSGNLTGRFLPRNDPRGIYLGHYTNCCQHPGAAGASAAWYGQESPRSGFFVVEDKRGQIVAESWAWISDSGGLSFESIESKGLGNRADTVAQIYSNAANECASE